MMLARFLLGRFLGYAALTAVAGSCAYLLAALLLDPRANYLGQSPAPPPEVVDAILTQRNLNDEVPLAERYAIWAGGVLTGDLGQTWDGGSVNAEIGRRIGVSLRLMVGGLFLGSVSGVLLGAWAAARQYGALDRLVSSGALVVLSVPTVVLAISLQNGAVWVNQAVGFELLRYTGEYTPGLTDGGWAGLANRVQQLLLPTVALALPQAAVYARYQRNLMLDVVHADFVRTALGKGLTRRSALFRHALRTAVSPMATYFGYFSAMLFTGAVFAEQVFGWHGVGEYLLQSVLSADVNAVAAVCGFTAVCLMAAALLADLAQALLDPRVRVA